MTQREFEEMMDSLTDEEIERLGIGSEKFNRRHEEFLWWPYEVSEKRKKRGGEH